MKTRIGLFSDSHRDERALSELLDRMGYIDAACFMGDVASDAQYLSDLLGARPNCPPLYAVRGNNDYRTTLPDDLLVEIGGKRLYLTHGHMCASLMSLAYRAREREADAALFGHTHVPHCEEAYGVWLINPGSAGNYCRGGRARASVMEIERGQICVLDVTL
ncbi:MAG: metallophosphoesterase [Clostridia bacterium]|nr:metallophosphoesterase [Clostridia bacterium]